MMVLLLRIIITALWLIFSSLLVSGFEPGGRYLILLEAAVIGGLVHLIRIFSSQRVSVRASSLLGASGVIFGLLLVRLIYTGMRLSVIGLWIVYTGVALTEMLIPEWYWEHPK